MITSNMHPSNFHMKTKYFSQKLLLYTRYCTNLTPPISPFHNYIPKTLPSISNASKRSMNCCQKLYNIVKFSQIISLSFHIRKMLWYLFWLFPETKTFINKNGKWKIPDLDRQIWISVQQPEFWYTINAWWTYVCVVIGFGSSGACV